MDRKDQISISLKENSEERYVAKEVNLDKERKTGIYTVDIDFDEASRHWVANKLRCGASYVYKTNGLILP